MLLWQPITKATSCFPHAPFRTETFHPKVLKYLMQCLFAKRPLCCHCSSDASCVCLWMKIKRFAPVLCFILFSSGSMCSWRHNSFNLIVLNVFVSLTTTNVSSEFVFSVLLLIPSMNTYCRHRLQHHTNECDYYYANKIKPTNNIKTNQH